MKTISIISASVHNSLDTSLSLKPELFAGIINIAKPATYAAPRQRCFNTSFSDPSVSSETPRKVKIDRELPGAISPFEVDSATPSAASQLEVIITLRNILTRCCLLNRTEINPIKGLCIYSLVV
jgi:hypothetical protein